MDTVSAIVERNEPVMGVFFESTNNNTNLSSLLAFNEVSDLRFVFHFVSSALGYVSIVSYKNTFVNSRNGQFLSADSTSSM